MKFNLRFDDDVNFKEIKRTGYLDRELKSFGYIKEKKISKREKKINNNKNNENEENKEKDEKEDNERKCRFNKRSIITNNDRK